MGELRLPPIPEPDPNAVALAGILEKLADAVADVTAEGTARIRALLEVGSAVDAEVGRGEIAILWYEDLPAALSDMELGAEQARSIIATLVKAQKLRRKILAGSSSTLSIIESRTPKLDHVEAAVEHVRGRIAAYEDVIAQAQVAIDDALDVLAVLEAQAMVREGEVEDGTVPQADVERDLGLS